MTKVNARKFALQGNKMSWQRQGAGAGLKYIDLQVGQVTQEKTDLKNKKKAVYKIKYRFYR